MRAALLDHPARTPFWMLLCDAQAGTCRGEAGVACKLHAHGERLLSHTWKACSWLRAGRRALVSAKQRAVGAWHAERRESRRAVGRQADTQACCWAGGSGA